MKLSRYQKSLLNEFMKIYNNIKIQANSLLIYKNICQF